MLKIATVARCEVLDGMEKYFCNAFYVDAFHKAGADLVIASSIDCAAWYAQHCDALLLPGGNDMDSSYFQKPLHPLAHTYTRPIDALDYAFIDAFMIAKKPILGICRGQQVLNVYFGGTLQQHFDTDLHAIEKDGQPMHPIDIKKDTFMASLYPQGVIVNSYHHQRIQKLAPSMLIAATHEDGTIEAIQHKVAPIWAVQWHPERLMSFDKIITGFLKTI